MRADGVGPRRSKLSLPFSFASTESRNKKSHSQRGSYLSACSPIRFIRSAGTTPDAMAKRVVCPF